MENFEIWLKVCIMYKSIVLSRRNVQISWMDFILTWRYCKCCGLFLDDGLLDSHCKRWHDYAKSILFSLWLKIV